MRLFGKLSSEREVVLVILPWGALHRIVGAIGMCLLLCLPAMPATAGAPVARATFIQRLEGKVARRIEREYNTLIGETRWNGTLSGRVIVPLDGVDISTFDWTTEIGFSFGYDPILGESVVGRLAADPQYRKGKRSARLRFQYRDEDRIGVESLVVGLRWTPTELTAHISGRMTRSAYPNFAAIPVDQIENRPGNRVVGYSGLVVTIAGRESRMDLVGEGQGRLKTEIFHDEPLTVGKVELDIASYEPQFDVEPPALELYDARIGTPQTRTVMLTNTGDETVSGSVEELEAPLAVTRGAGDFTLTPGQSLEIDVTFTPTDKKFYYARIRIPTTSNSRPVVYVPLVARVGYAPPPHSRPIQLHYD